MNLEIFEQQQFQIQKGNLPMEESIQGTYLYVKMPNWPEKEEKFIYDPFTRHVSCIYGGPTPGQL